jgi:hypothetical protein
MLCSLAWPPGGNLAKVTKNRGTSQEGIFGLQCTVYYLRRIQIANSKQYIVNCKFIAIRQQIPRRFAPWDDAIARGGKKSGAARNCSIFQVCRAASNFYAQTCHPDPPKAERDLPAIAPPSFLSPLPALP